MEKDLNKIYPHEISQRINTLIFRFCKGNKTLFAKRIGVSQQRINRLFSIDSRTNKYPKPSDDIIDAVLSYHPEVDKVWLLTGEGGIINVKESSSDVNSIKGNTTINNGGNNKVIMGDNNEVQHISQSEELVLLRQENEHQRKYIEQLQKNIELLEKLLQK